MADPDAASVILKHDELLCSKKLISFVLGYIIMHP